METIFDLQNVSHSYLDKFEALKDINLTITAGEQITIIGANGSGKSTLLLILDALIYATSGEVYAFGNPVTEERFNALEDNEFARYFRTKVGFVFQNPDVQLFSSTVFDEIAFGPLQLGLPREDVVRRTEEVMAMLALSNIRDRAPHTLSGGERKKVCIGSILSINPDVLLLDEPTGGLDPRTQLWLTELLQDLAKAGKTIITATHDMNIVEQISTRSIVFGEDHTIRADCSSTEVMNDQELLLSANLIHEHQHWHGELLHKHPHPSEGGHHHEQVAYHVR
jgi:cobalt/nickel transport system ATP-binding protein